MSYIFLRLVYRLLKESMHFIITRMRYGIKHIPTCVIYATTLLCIHGVYIASNQKLLAHTIEEFFKLNLGD